MKRSVSTTSARSSGIASKMRVMMTAPFQALSRTTRGHQRDIRHGLSTPGCLFCEQNRPDLNNIFMENETCFARFDNFPATEGHAEIIPKRHVVSFFELSQREVSDAYALLVRAKTRLQEEHDPDGYTIGINEGRAAGRTVDHLHIHLIPRSFGDVRDPRGGIRQVVPNFTPDDWMAHDAAPIDLRSPAAETVAGPQQRH